MQNKERTIKRLPTVRAPQYLQEIILIAATGQHPILLMENWIPDTSTLIARRIPEILPPISANDSERTKQNYRLARVEEQYRANGSRPFRAPHHTASTASVTGSTERAGETALAHNGVLYLHDVAELATRTLNALAEIRQSGETVHADRDGKTVRYPSDILIVGRMMACPCGQWPFECTCTPEALRQFQAQSREPKLANLFTMLSPPKNRNIGPRGQDAELDTESLCTRVEAARRFAARTRNQTVWNEKVADDEARFDEHHRIEGAAEPWTGTEKTRVRVLKVARTIADLAGAPIIRTNHLQAAMGLTTHLHPAD